MEHLKSCGKEFGLQPINEASRFKVIDREKKGVYLHLQPC